MNQKERVLRHLQDHGSITQLEAMQDYGIMRLTNRVGELMQAGYPIKSELVKGSNRYGEKTRYSRYTLENRGVQ